MEAFGTLLPIGLKVFPGFDVVVHKPGTGTGWLEQFERN
jgi:hypothetical protein